MRTLLLPVLALALAAAPHARAEKADREKEVNVGADQLTADDRERTSVFDGNVVVTQGTMRITAAKVTVKEDADRFKFYVATGSPVTFRQKRDKAEDFVEGWAARAEYDDKSAKLKLFDKARLKSVQGEIIGDVIVYDTNNDRIEVTGGPDSGANTSRVKAKLLPQKKPGDKPEPAAPGVTLKPDTAPGTR